MVLQSHQYLIQVHVLAQLGKKNYEKHLSHLEFLLLDSILNVQMDSRNHILVAFIQSVNFPTEHVQSSILLVVPVTDYNSNVPLLLGTNVAKQTWEIIFFKLLTCILHGTWHLHVL